MRGPSSVPIADSMSTCHPTSTSVYILPLLWKYEIS